MLERINTPLNHGASIRPVSSQPKFGLVRQITEPPRIYTNDRIELKSSQLVEDLMARLDEAMTVAGETYSGKEAFTNLIELNLVPKSPDAYRPEKMDSAVDTRVLYADNIGKEKQTGIMVLSSNATDYYTGKGIATSRATFNAIDPNSVAGSVSLQKLFAFLNVIHDKLIGKKAETKEGEEKKNFKEMLSETFEALRPPKRLATVPVKTLQPSDAETAGNASANKWNLELSKFYREVATRLQARSEEPGLPEVPTGNGTWRLTNQNFYVTPNMLNKKQTGHGGIAAANAVQDMLALTRKAANNYPVPILEKVTATYLDAFLPSDSLQFETTIDHVEAGKSDVGGTPQQTVYLSTRINKMDTKGGKVKGPIILVNARMKIDTALFPQPPLDNDDAQKRQAEAIAWSKLS